jgi:hypothetical protein
MFDQAMEAVAKIALEAQVASRQWGVPVAVELVVMSHGMMGLFRGPGGELFGETDVHAIDTGAPPSGPLTNLINK